MGVLHFRGKRSSTRFHIRIAWKVPATIMNLYAVSGTKYFAVVEVGEVLKGIIFCVCLCLPERCFEFDLYILFHGPTENW
jgi:hypothetical protein